jgi:transcriptional regulator with XRE-family HTH domain
MPTPFSEKLRLVLKILSMSSVQLASELGIDKSVVSRWLKGAVQPSPHNLARLSALIATRVGGFRSLDWERDLRGLAEVCGADASAIQPAAARPAAPGLPIAIWEQMLIGASVRGKAYEGFFRSIRPHATLPRRFVYEYAMIRRNEIGLLQLNMGSADTTIEGWVIPINGQVYVIAADVNNGALLFGLFNGSGANRVDVFDGLALKPAYNIGRSPTATSMLCERIGDLSGDREADDRRYAELAAQSSTPPDGAISEALEQHMVWDIGPSQIEAGGDWLLNMSLDRSMTRGGEPERGQRPKR